MLFICFIFDVEFIIFPYVLIDVSLAAMQYINNYYMSRQLEQEPEFISQCMDNLSAAARELHASSEESRLLCIQRALLLLKTHLETFKRR
jgi:ubiquitin carboxyl-terminal hydrolase 34